MLNFLLEDSKRDLEKEKVRIFLNWIPKERIALFYFSEINFLIVKFRQLISKIT